MLSFRQIKVLRSMREVCEDRFIRYGERCDNFFIDYKTKGGIYVRAYYNINGNLKLKIYCRYYDYIQGIPGCIIFKREIKIDPNEQLIKTRRKLS